MWRGPENGPWDNCSSWFRYFYFCSRLLLATCGLVVAIDNSLLFSGRSHASGRLLFQLDSIKSVSLSGSFTLRRYAPPSVAADVVNPRRRPAPNLPTVTLQASKETYLLSHNRTKFVVDSSNRYPFRARTDRRDWTPYPRRRLGGYLVPFSRYYRLFSPELMSSRDSVHAPFRDSLSCVGWDLGQSAYQI